MSKIWQIMLSAEVFTAKQNHKNIPLWRAWYLACLTQSWLVPVCKKGWLGLCGLLKIKSIWMSKESSLLYIVQFDMSGFVFSFGYKIGRVIIGIPHVHWCRSLGHSIQNQKPWHRRETWLEWLFEAWKPPKNLLRVAFLWLL